MSCLVPSALFGFMLSPFLANLCGFLINALETIDFSLSDRLAGDVTSAEQDETRRRQPASTPEHPCCEPVAGRRSPVAGATSARTCFYPTNQVPTTPKRFLSRKSAHPSTISCWFSLKQLLHTLTCSVHACACQSFKFPSTYRLLRL